MKRYYTTNWLAVAKYPHISIENGGCFSFYVYFVFPLWPTILLHGLTIWATRWVSCKNQKLITLREHMGSSRSYGGSVLLNFLVFCWLCSSYDLSAVCCHCLLIVHFWLPLQFSLTFIFGRVPNSNRKIVQNNVKIDTPNTHIHDRSLSSLGMQTL